MDYELIKRFENYLFIKRGLARRTVANYMITIRTIYNIAIQKSLAEPKFYPFGKGKYQIKFPETQKIGLTSAEIIILETIRGLSTAQQYALNAWLISFYFAGIRISDVLQLKWKDFLDSRLYYRMGKNQKLVSLKIPIKVNTVLNRIDRNDDSIYVFKELENINLKDKRALRSRIKSVTRNFNRRLEFVAEKAGKIFGIVLALFSMGIAPLLYGVEGGIFTYLQELNGTHSVPILAIILVGIFNKRVSAKAANISILFSVVTYLLTLYVIKPDISFLHLMGILFVLTVIIMFVMTAFNPRTSDYHQEYTKQVDITNWRYLKPVGYAIVALVIALYISLS